MAYDGYLDVSNGWKIWGWAFDARRPNDALEIEYQLSTGESGVVTASEFRPDLLQHGIGNGRHAFSIELPVYRTWPDDLTVSARVRGADFVLKGAPKPVAMPLNVSLIAGDIVNNCNLRCPFCIVDYSNIKGLKLMKEETFRKMFSFLPALPPGNFWLSCLHEPTMHPRFIDFIEMVPPEYRNRLSFTTNLTRRVAPDFFARLVNSGIHSIRISFDSRTPAVFEELRKGAKYETFQANLQQLTAELAKAPRRPHLRFITMAFRENHTDIPDLVRYCRDELRGDSHEVRFMFYLPHLAKWGKTHMVTREEWANLEQALQPLRTGDNLEVNGPYPGMREQFEAEQGVAEYVAQENAFGGADDASALPPPSAQAVGAKLPDEPIRLRMRYDGLLGIESCPDEVFRVNVGQLEDVNRYFYGIRVSAKLAASSELPAMAAT